jgi:hypothetical protein
MELKSDYPIRMPCDLLALPRSSWYYSRVKRDVRELKKAVEQVNERQTFSGKGQTMRRIFLLHCSGDFMQRGNMRRS